MATQFRESAVLKAPDFIDVQVGMRIKIRRRLIGLSREALAEALGVTFQRLQKYESGQNRVSASRLSAIAAHLDVAISHFFPEGDLDPKAAIAENDLFGFISTKEARELNQAFIRIASPHIQKRFILLVKVISGAELGRDDDLFC